jgi:hypothetical protein
MYISIKLDSHYVKVSIQPGHMKNYLRLNEMAQQPNWNSITTELLKTLKDSAAFFA